MLCYFDRWGTLTPFFFQHFQLNVTGSSMYLVLLGMCHIMGQVTLKTILLSDICLLQGCRDISSNNVDRWGTLAPFYYYVDFSKLFCPI